MGDISKGQPGEWMMSWKRSLTGIEWPLASWERPDGCLKEKQRVKGWRYGTVIPTVRTRVGRIYSIR